MSPPQPSPLCAACGRPTATGDLRCIHCGHALVDPDRVEAARQRTLRLLEIAKGDPYLRSAGLLGYTLRSHVRGFLDEPDHPLALLLLGYLYQMAREGGPAALRQLAPHAEREWIEEEAPVLTRALRYLRERFGEELVGAASGHGGRDFEAWHASLPRRGRIDAAPGDDHSM